MYKFPFPILIRPLLICLALAIPRIEAQTKEKPLNLVFILVDDLGYGDLPCYGNTVHRTPNIDRLASEGAKLTSYYVTSPVCTPTRYALLTGRHPAREQMFEVLWPPTQGGMDASEITLAEWLKGQGYTTGLAGKWHLGHSDPSLLPPSQGFDSWYGMPYPNDMDANHTQTKNIPGEWPPMPMYRQYEIVEAPINVDLLTQQYTAEAVRFIAENHHRPFFLFLSHAMPHAHLGASADFKGKSANGLYGDALEELDWSVGEIMRSLRAFDLDENTLVIFTSDNGALDPSSSTFQNMSPADGICSNAPFRGGKGKCLEGGIRMPAIFRWPGHIEAGRVIDEPTIITDTAATFSDLAGLSPMTTAIDSVSIAPVLLGEASAPERSLFFGSGDARAIRKGKWKFHLTEQPSWQREILPHATLYDLSQDQSESVNLIQKFPAVAEELRKEILAFETAISP